MRTCLTLILLGLLTVGCAALPTPAAVAAPTGAPVATALPSQPQSQTLPQSVRANPPRIPVGPVQGTPVFTVTLPAPLPPAGASFTSPALGVTVALPAGWTALPAPDGARFVSPQGTITLAAVDTTQDKFPGFQCTDLAGEGGMTLLACADPSTGRYHATFTWTAADGATRTAFLSTQDAAALAAYRAMLATLHPAP